MGKHKRLTLIEILLILAIIAVLVVWLFPRFWRILDSNFPTVGIVKPYIGDASGTGGLTSRNSYNDLLDRIIGNNIS
jgi:hypothetical protein